MAYIVQASVPDLGDNATSVTVANREDALATAVWWLDHGVSGVKIIGDGHIYTPGEFALTLGTSSQSPRTNAKP
jgi:hypothetical protein